MFCVKCGYPLEDGDTFCPNCGARNDGNGYPEAYPPQGDPQINTPQGFEPVQDPYSNAQDPYGNAPLGAVAGGSTGGTVKPFNAKIFIPIAIAAVIAISVAVYYLNFASAKYSLKDYSGDPYFEGYNGEGYFVDMPINSETAYDKAGEKAAQLEDVLNTVYVTCDPDGNLSNGQKVKVTAEYDKSLAKRYRIKLTDLTREVEVSDLYERVSPDNITNEFYGALRDRGRTLVGEDVSSAEKFSVDPVGAYYSQSDEKVDGFYEDYMYLIYKATYSYRGWWDDELETTTEYYVVKTDPIMNVEDPDIYELYIDASYSSETEAVNNITKLNGYGCKIVKLAK